MGIRGQRAENLGPAAKNPLGPESFPGRFSSRIPSAFGDYEDGNPRHGGPRWESGASGRKIWGQRLRSARNPFRAVSLRESLRHSAIMRMEILATEAPDGNLGPAGGKSGASGSARPGILSGPFHFANPFGIRRL